MEWIFGKGGSRMGGERRVVAMAETMKILGHEVEVVGDDTLLGERGAQGLWCEHLLKITIGSRLKAAVQGSVLLHEVVEAVNSLLALELEHTQITALETALHQVIVENPEMVGRVMRGEAIVGVCSRETNNGAKEAKTRGAGSGRVGGKVGG